ncbi:MAG: SAM-dependent methyltransferase [Gammaproteobacteria bacterium]|jgi:SAM-dependent methyltransferase
MGKTKKNIKHNKVKITKADKADIHILYEDSVQCVESEIDFVDDTYKEIRGKRAKHLREDFCGTMNTSCEWVRRRKSNIAYSVDIDQDVLDWGKKNKLNKLNKLQHERINIIRGDVTTTNTENMDIVLAMNFSYWIFKDRQTMTNYYRHIYNNLSESGIFFLDSFGGPEAIKELEEDTEYDDFTYTWDQHKYNPITGDGLFHIHFKFDDGSKIKKAYTYDWRVWTLPEITEMLADAGFKPYVYWEGTGEDGEGNGEFYRTLRGEADDSWIAYIVAVK